MDLLRLSSPSRDVKEVAYDHRSMSEQAIVSVEPDPCL